MKNKTTKKSTPCFCFNCLETEGAEVVASKKFDAGSMMGILDLCLPCFDLTIATL